MVAHHSSDPATREIRLAARTHKLENAYNECLREAAVAIERESSRRLRLKIVLLEQENEDLCEQAGHHEEQIDDLLAARDELAEEAAANSKGLETTRIELRTKGRQVDTLTAELQSMKGLSSDSSKILSEKLALSRELAALKPQVEHLQAQLASNQNLLAEKLSLERELTAIQVELDNERRAASKSRARDPEHGANLEKTSAQIEQLKANLANEKRERGKAEREHAAKLEEATVNNDLLESRVEAFKTKLKTAKDLLKEAQDQAKANMSKAKPARDSGDSTAGANTAARKRNHAQMDPDAAVGTPGDRLPVKRGRRTSAALAGEKSTFSITPFLNKTGDVAAESPAESPSRPAIKSTLAAMEMDISDASPTPKQRKKNSAMVQTKTADGPAVSKGLNANSKLKTKCSTEKLARKSSLDQVTEENDENEHGSSKLATATQHKQAASGISADAGKPALKKKRKLLGKTIFDEDDDTTISRRDDSIFSKSGLSLGRPLAKQGLGLAPRVPTNKGSSFTAFSPLKRDRGLLA